MLLFKSMNKTYAKEVNIKQRINLWSFILTFVCWVLFLLTATTPLNIHSIVLILAIIIFITSFVGLGGMSNWISLLRSFLSLIGCALLIIIEMVVIFFGELMNYVE